MPTVIPAAGRGAARLTPRAMTALPSATVQYLNSQTPACSVIAFGLMGVAVLTLIGFSVRYSHRNRRHSGSPSEGPILHAYSSEKVERNKKEQGSGPSPDRQCHQVKADRKTGAMERSHIPIAEGAMLRQESPSVSDARWREESERTHLSAVARLSSVQPTAPTELCTTTTIYFEGPLQRHETLDMDENPDYYSATSSPTSDISPSFSSQSRRRSYTRPNSVNSFTSTSEHPLWSPREATRTMLSSSYPPSEGLLPAASPALSRTTEDATKHHHAQTQGGLTSSTIEHGTGWTRHTRVFDGGVCLACAASGSRHGGFYGPNVRPEDMIH